MYKMESIYNMVWKAGFSELISEHMWYKDKAQMKSGYYIIGAAFKDCGVFSGNKHF